VRVASLSWSTGGLLRWIVDSVCVCVCVCVCGVSTALGLYVSLIPGVGRVIPSSEIGVRVASPTVDVLRGGP